MIILVLAAGEDASTGDRAAYPLWLSEVEGTTVLERQVKSFKGLEPIRFVFTFRREDIQAFHLENIVSLLADDCAVVEIARRAQGAACTALLASDCIDPDAELIVVSATDYIDAPIDGIVEGFRSQQADAGVIVFSSVHPRYSYVRSDIDGNVIEAAEKRPISRDAVAGFYWFARGGDFLDAVKKMIAKDASVNGQFFIAPALNELILKQKKVVSHQVALDRYHPLKAQQHVEALEHALERHPHEA